MNHQSVLLFILWVVSHICCLSLSSMRGRRPDWETTLRGWRSSASELERSSAGTQVSWNHQKYIEIHVFLVNTIAGTFCTLLCCKRSAQVSTRKHMQLKPWMDQNYGVQRKSEWPTTWHGYPTCLQIEGSEPPEVHWRQQINHYSHDRTTYAATRQVAIMFKRMIYIYIIILYLKKFER